MAQPFTIVVVSSGYDYFLIHFPVDFRVISKRFHCHFNWNFLMWNDFGISRVEHFKLEIRKIVLIFMKFVLLLRFLFILQLFFSCRERNDLFQLFKNLLKKSFIELRIDGNLSFSVIFGMVDQRREKRCKNNYSTFFSWSFQQLFLEHFFKLFIVLQSYQKLNENSVGKI